MSLAFDRRVDGWITVDAYLFEATYFEGFLVEIQVNPEFGSAMAALVEAEKYAEEIGRLPTALRTDVETVWIHQGTQLFGGGNDNILIHIGQAELYIADGILEETLAHEGAHTSLDADYAAAPGCLPPRRPTTDSYRLTQKIFLIGKTLPKALFPISLSAIARIELANNSGVPSWTPYLTESIISIAWD